MKILITGGNGFLASNISEKLVQDKYNVTSISRQSNFDLRNTKDTNTFFEDKYFDVVIHCAISGGRRLIEDSADIVNDNIRMACNILLNRSHYNKLIHFGSGAELDRSLDINGQNSFNNVLPEDYYGFSKNIITRLFSTDENIYNLRIFNVFSHNESKGRMITNSVLNYIDKKPIIINQDKMMDFMYFEDFYKILTKYINQNNLPNDIDCVYDKKIKLTDIAEIINNLSDYNVDVILENNEFGKSYCGISRIEDIEYIGLEEGIKEVYKKLL